jgi:hypothetical protein
MELCAQLHLVLQSMPDEEIAKVCNRLFTRGPSGIMASRSIEMANKAMNEAITQALLMVQAEDAK